MAANGFLEQRTRSPAGFGVVLLLHGAAIAAVLMIKGPTWIIDQDPPLTIDTITEPRAPDPEPPPPEPRPDQPTPPQRQTLDVPPRQVETELASAGPVVPPGPPVREWTVTNGTGTSLGTTTATTEVPVRRPDPPPAVRVDALFDPRFMGELQPPYPPSEQRNEREGSVRIQVTIGTNGRVLAATRIAATSDAFWRVTEQQARTRWRFRPATIDGRPVESTKTLTVHFRLDQ